MYPTAIGVQETELCVLGQGHSVTAQVGVTITSAGVRTSEITKVLIVMLGALAPAVTDMFDVQADRGATTAVEVRAGGRVAQVLVVMQWTVPHPIAQNKQWQAVALT